MKENIHEALYLFTSDQLDQLNQCSFAEKRVITKLRTICLFHLEFVQQSAFSGENIKVTATVFEF